MRRLVPLGDSIPKILVIWGLLAIFDKSEQYEIESGLCGESRNTVASARIVNGQVSEAGEWPWQVLMMKDGMHSCGASLISEEWILTASHCIIEDVKDISLFVGAHRIDASGKNAQEVIAHLYILHEGYDDSSFVDDICLIRLTKPVEFTDFITPVCLPSTGTMVSIGDRMIATGWGYTQGTGSDEELREAVLPVIDTELCASWYDSIRVNIPDKHFCAGYQEGGIDTCFGDSGGPLVHEETSTGGKKAYVLRGITSFGSGCAVRERPGVYVRASEYLDWINEKISNSSSNYCSPVLSSACGGTITKSTILRNPTTMPRFHYPPSRECEWNIIAPSNYGIKFNFVCYFLMSPMQKQCDDHLSIVNKSGYNKTFCGNDVPKPFIVMDNTATVRFSTDAKLEYPGFVMEIELVPRWDEATTQKTLESSSEGPSMTSSSDSSENTTNNGYSRISYPISIILVVAGSNFFRI